MVSGTGSRLEPRLFLKIRIGKMAGQRGLTATPIATCISSLKMAKQASEYLFSTLMDISDTIREKALTLSENEEPKGIICNYIVFQFVINHLKVF